MAKISVIDVDTYKTKKISQDKLAIYIRLFYSDGTEVDEPFGGMYYHMYGAYNRFNVTFGFYKVVDIDSSKTLTHIGIVIQKNWYPILDGSYAFNKFRIDFIQIRFQLFVII